MGWVRISDDFYDNRKFNRLTALGDSAWVRGLAYCNRNLTDGFIPTRTARSLVDTTGLSASPMDAVAELVAEGLWEEVEGGYQVHDYLDYQLSAEHIRSRAEANRERVRRFTERKKREAEPVDNPADNADANALANGGSNGPATPYPNPNPNNALGDVTAAPLRPSKPAAKSPAARATRVPADFAPDADLLAYAARKAPALNAERETEKFVNFWASKSGASAVKLDWRRTWQNWMLNGQERAEQNGWRPPVAGQQHDRAESASREEARDAWLRARGVTREEYELRKAESGWLDSLKEIS